MTNKIGPKLEYTYGLPRKQLYAPVDEVAEVALPPPKDRLTTARKVLQALPLEIPEEDIKVVSDADSDLPTTNRESPTITVRLTLEELEAVDRVKGMRSRTSFIRVLVQRAVRAIEAQQE